MNTKISKGILKGKISKFVLLVLNKGTIILNFFLQLVYFWYNNSNIAK